jgi:hypothetical protein
MVFMGVGVTRDGDGVMVTVEALSVVCFVGAEPEWLVVISDLGVGTVDEPKGRVHECRVPTRYSAFRTGDCWAVTPRELDSVRCNFLGWAIRRT